MVQNKKRKRKKEKRKGTGLRRGDSLIYNIYNIYTILYIHIYIYSLAQTLHVGGGPSLILGTAQSYKHSQE